MKSKILIADDEEIVQRLLKRAFKGLPYTLLSAFDGEDALQIAFKEMPDLVLLDLDMPKKNGIEVLQSMRSNALTQAIPIIVITGGSKLSNREECLKMGANDYITKPFQIEELKTRVKNLLPGGEKSVEGSL